MNEELYIDELKALEIAEIILRYQNGVHCDNEYNTYEKNCRITLDDGTTRYSDYGQDQFNSILKAVKRILLHDVLEERKAARS